MIVGLACGPTARAVCTSDQDGDGVCDGADLCPHTVTGADVDAFGCPPYVPGDFDNDGDLDGLDLLVMTICGSGPKDIASPACRNAGFDLDADLDVDVADFAIFQRCFSGAGIPANPDCAGQSVVIDGGCLHIHGTAADAVLALRLQAGVPGMLEIDLGNDGQANYRVDRSLFTCINIDADAGDDVVYLDDVNGVFTDTEVTTVRGGAGVDTLWGGAGGETFIGGPGDDTVYMGGGDDHFVWSDGDGSDVVNGEGDGDNDIVEINGGDAGEDFAVTANGGRVRVDRLSPDPFILDIGTSEQLVFHTGGGDDSLACVGNLAALIAITADGGPGADTLLGGNGADLLVGGDGDDFVDGNQGNDTVLLGAGNDTAQWDPGDGSDIIEGQAGDDQVVFNGSNANENFVLGANGARVRLTRDIGNIVLDINAVEHFTARALGGTDVLTVNDLTGTGLADVTADLAANGGGGDAAIDNVVINTTDAADEITVSGGAAGGVVTRGTVAVTVITPEPAIDRLTINTLAGADQITVREITTGLPGVTIEGGADADSVEVDGDDVAEAFAVTANGTLVRFDRLSPAAFFLDMGTVENLVLNAGDGADSLTCTGNLAALIAITADGGPGADTLLGGNGADLLIGGDGDDFVDGNQGNDTILLGAGFDVCQWDPGDGNDTIEGQADTDRLVINGSNASEIYEFSRNGSRVRFTRNVGNIVLDVDGVEKFATRALGGTDVATVNDLGGTAAQEVEIDLAATGGTTSDGTADSVIVNGTDNADTIDVLSSLGAAVVSGLPVITRVTHPDATLDALTVNGLGGADTITAGPGLNSLILFTANP